MTQVKKFEEFIARFIFHNNLLWHMDMIRLPKKEYDELVAKAKLFDHYVRTEQFTKKELSIIKKAMKGPFLTKSAFLERFPELD